MKNNILLLTLLLNFSIGETVPDIPIQKEFIEPGRVDALAPYPDNQILYLIQFDLHNDSLLNLITNSISELDLLNGPASYQRILPEEVFIILPSIIDENYYRIIRENYIQPDGRGYFVQYQYGSQSSGSGGDVGYDCMCTDGSDCLIIGYNDDWWDPLDYYGEAWWSFTPPPLQYIDDLQISVQGVQCDNLPLWSETYVTVKQNDCSWANDLWQAELSIDYTVNGPYTLPQSMYNNVFCDDAITPVIWSEDNYSVDYVKVEMYYTCNNPAPPNGFEASDNLNCNNIELSWNNDPTSEGYILYRDNVAITPLSAGTTNYIDTGASPGEHTYCLESENYCGVSYQSCDVGSRQGPLDPPEGVDASDGTYNSVIYVSWDDLNEATGYKVYRNGVWLGSTSENQTEYFDEYVEDQIEYNYCITSLNDCGESLENCDMGVTGFLMGDLNDDSSIDVLDVVLMVNIILGLNSYPSDFELFISDLNNDSMINVQDVILLINIILN